MNYDGAINYDAAINYNGEGIPVAAASGGGGGGRSIRDVLRVEFRPPEWYSDDDEIMLLVNT